MSSIAAGVPCILAGWEVKKKRKDDCRAGWEERGIKIPAQECGGEEAQHVLSWKRDHAVSVTPKTPL